MDNILRVYLLCLKETKIAGILLILNRENFVKRIYIPSSYVFSCDNTILGECSEKIYALTFRIIIVHNGE